MLRLDLAIVSLTGATIVFSVCFSIEISMVVVIGGATVAWEMVVTGLIPICVRAAVVVDVLAEGVLVCCVNIFIAVCVIVGFDVVTGCKVVVAAS